MIFGHFWFFFVPFFVSDNVCGLGYSASVDACLCRLIIHMIHFFWKLKRISFIFGFSLSLLNSFCHTCSVVWFFFYIIMWLGVRLNAPPWMAEWPLPLQMRPPPPPSGDGPQRFSYILYPRKLLFSTVYIVKKSIFYICFNIIMTIILKFQIKNYS